MEVPSTIYLSKVARATQHRCYTVARFFKPLLLSYSLLASTLLMIIITLHTSITARAIQTAFFLLFSVRARH